MYWFTIHMIQKKAVVIAMADLTTNVMIQMEK